MSTNMEVKQRELTIVPTLKKLENTVSAIENQVSVLQERLAYITRARVEACGTTEKEKSVEICGLTSDLRNFDERLAVVAATLTNQIENLEI